MSSLPQSVHVLDAGGRHTGQVKYWDLGPPNPGREPVTAATLVDNHPVVQLAKKHGLKGDVLAEMIQTYPVTEKGSPEYTEWKAKKAEFDAWEKENGGPVEYTAWAPVAREAVSRDSDRYVWHLPKGSKPGPGDDQRKARELERAQEFGPDPIYGSITK